MPGAGGIKAMNFLATVAPKDGTTIGLVHSSVPFAPIYGIKGASFDPRKMSWIGSIATANGICVAWAASGVKSWQDLLDGKYIVGTSGAGSQMETLPLMLNRLFGAKIKVIPGYKGGNDVYLAMERGEVNGRCGGLVSSIHSTRPDWFPQHKITVPIQLTMKRTKLFPDTVAVGELVKDEKTRKVLSLIFAPQDIDRPILTPPGVPAERVAMLRKAFHETMIDPRFEAEAKKQRLEIDEVTGEEVTKVIDDAFDLTPDVVATAKTVTSTTSH
jgi:tripartite-type tricarboxylate transporter receptor subunit TctC